MVGKTIHWTQGELNAFIDKVQGEGWPIASHAVGLEAHRMLLDAFELAKAKYPVSAVRNRIEHVVMVSDSDLQRMKNLGLIASIQFNGPNEWPDDPVFYERVAPEQYHVAGWRDLIEAGIPTAGSDDWPWGDVNGQDPPFGSPIRLLYQAVTRVGNNGRPPDDWMLDQAISMWQALQLLTINGAYATMEEEIKGSLHPGRWQIWISSLPIPW